MMTYICILVIAHVIGCFCCMVHISLKITGPSNLSTIYKTVKHDAYQHELSDYWEAL